jgi:ribonuclease HI
VKLNRAEWEWETTYEHTHGIHVDMEEAHIACDGSANMTSVGYAWMEIQTAAWSAGGTTIPLNWTGDTSAYAEAHAILHAIHAYRNVNQLHLYTDCLNLVEMHKKLLTEEPIKLETFNTQWIQELLHGMKIRKHHVHLHWVEGHSNHLENHVADRLANWARKNVDSHTPPDIALANQIINHIRISRNFPPTPLH